MSFYQLLVLLTRGRTSILVETPHITLSLGCLHPPSRTEVLRELGEICERHQVTKAIIAGHSFGSVKVSWLVAHRPDLVAQIVLLDPVCILLMLPDVCYNFLYRRPISWYEHVIYHLAAQELTIANAIRRHFWWSENVLLVEQLRCPLTVVLAANDEVAPARTIREYLKRMSDGGTGPPIRIVWLEGFSHGQVLFDHGAVERVVMEVMAQAAELQR